MLAVNFLVVKLDLSLIFCKIVIILLIIAYLFNLLIYFHLLFESYFLFFLLLNQQLFHFVNFSSEYHPLCNFFFVHLFTPLLPIPYLFSTFCFHFK
jgi:hypothetical protein